MAAVTPFVVSDLMRKSDAQTIKSKKMATIKQANSSSARRNETLWKRCWARFMCRSYIIFEQKSVQIWTHVSLTIARDSKKEGLATLLFLMDFGQSTAGVVVIKKDGQN